MVRIEPNRSSAGRRGGHNGGQFHSGQRRDQETLEAWFGELALCPLRTGGRGQKRTVRVDRHPRHRLRLARDGVDPRGPQEVVAAPPMPGRAHPVARYGWENATSSPRRWRAAIAPTSTTAAGAPPAITTLRRPRPRACEAGVLCEAPAPPRSNPTAAAIAGSSPDRRDRLAGSGDLTNGISTGSSASTHHARSQPHSGGERSTTARARLIPSARPSPTTFVVPIGARRPHDLRRRQDL